MYRRFVPFMLLLALLWQSVAYAGSVLAVQLDEVEHAGMHVLSEKHHHADDGTVQKDDSAESKLHLAADACFCPLSLAPFEWAFRFANTSFAPEVAGPDVLEERCVVPARRPPR